MDTESTPQETLSKFFSAWKDSQWAEMAEHSQLTWRSHHSDPAHQIEGMFARPLGGFEVGQSEVISDCCEHVSFKLSLGKGFSGQRIEGWANVIRETGAYEPDPTGQWGVNPVSVLKAIADATKKQ